MKLSEKAITEFREIYQKRYDTLLKEEEVNELGLELLDLFKSIYRSVPINDYASLMELDNS